MRNRLLIVLLVSSLTSLSASLSINAPGVATDVESVSATFGGSHKILRAGQLLIIRAGKTYDTFGRLVD